MDFNTLHNQYQHFFNIVENPRVGGKYNNSYFMAFDAEWYQSGDRNVVLSYQIATVSRTASNNIIEFVAPGQRLKLAEIVEFGIRSVNNGVIPEGHATARNLVILISHSTVAEWSVLADRDAPYITSQLTSIRKSPVTSLLPINIVLGDYTCSCDVQLYDTRLIAPADYQSLKKLSTMLGSDDELKVEIGYHNIKRMDWLIRNDYNLYEKYALQDSEITLKLFFLLQSTLMVLAENDQKLYRTLASGAVTGYFKKAVNFKTYQEQLNASGFKTPYGLIRLAYYGGRNEGFMVGRSDRVPEINDRLWVDIDFVGCYPTAMALCPTIDCGTDPFTKPPRYNKKNPPPVFVPGEIKHLPSRYHLPDMSTAELQAAGIKKAHYDKACAILNQLEPGHHTPYQKKWNEFTRTLSPRDRKRLLAKALVFDNTLLDDWYDRCQHDNAERHLIPGFAKVRFAFDVKVVNGRKVKKDPAQGDYITAYPCLPVSHPAYGLIYPVEGETYATVPELMLALDAGCHLKVIESVELPVVTDGSQDIPKRLFFDHLADLTKMRIQQKKQIKDQGCSADIRQKAVVMERFIKEFMNSFYGKTAQAINYKRMYDPETGLMKALGPSPISEACTSSLTTGLPRAALSAILLAIDQYNQNRPLSNQIVMASCTTDGLLVGLPRPDGITASSYYEEKTRVFIKPVVNGVGGDKTSIKYHDIKKDIPTVNDMLDLCGCSDLISLIDSYLPIRQMRNSRSELTEGKDDSFLEIKHFADHVAGIKTRGQIGWMNINGEDIVTIQAKFGLKPPVTDIINQGNDELTCEDVLDEKKSLKDLDEEYEHIMAVGGSAKATLECNWILEQIDRLNNGEADLFEYTFYGLKSFNEIIKGGRSLDLTQTKGNRRFNADFDWKRKLVVKNNAVSPFSEPHHDIREMLAHRNQVEKHHSWGKIATGETVIQSVAVKNSGINFTGGVAAAVVKQLLSAMLFDHIPGGVKVADCSGRKNQKYDEIAAAVNDVWQATDCRFEKRTSTKGLSASSRPAKTEWTKSDIQNITRANKWVPAAIPFQMQYDELLTALCKKFTLDVNEAREKIFAMKITDSVDTGLMLQVALAVMHAPSQGIEPFKSMYTNHRLPNLEEIIRAFQPHIPESLLASYEHIRFEKGQCQLADKGKLVMYFLRAGMRKEDAESCASVMVPIATEGRQDAPRNRSKEKIVRVLSQALRVLANPPVSVSVITSKLQRHGLNVAQFHQRQRSKMERNVIKDTAENRQEIRKLVRLFSLDPEPFLVAMLDK